MLSVLQGGVASRAPWLVLLSTGILMHLASTGFLKAQTRQIPLGQGQTRMRVTECQLLSPSETFLFYSVPD